MDEAHCQPVRDADPGVGRERQRTCDRARIEVGLDRQPHEDLAAIEHKGLGTRGGAGGQHRRDHERAHAATVACLLAASAAAGCQADLADLDSIYSGPSGRAVHCAIDLDAKANISFDSIDGGLDRAREHGEIIELYAHNPGKTVPLATIEHVLAGAMARGLEPVTYADFAHGEARAPGLALSFDDTSVQAWVDALPLLEQYGARVTFFVSRYTALHDNERALIRQLADAGHDIEPHTVNHPNAPQYVETNGLTAYLNDEVWPSVDRLEADGYEVNAFAYPFGARTGEIDNAIKARVPVLRSVEFSYSGVVSPCPN